MDIFQFLRCVCKKPLIISYYLWKYYSNKLVYPKSIEITFGINLLAINQILKLIHKKSPKLQHPHHPLSIQIILRERINILQLNLPPHHILTNNLSHLFHLIQQHLHNLPSRLNLFQLFI